MAAHGGGPPRQKRFLPAASSLTGTAQYRQFAGPASISGFKNFIHPPAGNDRFLLDRPTKGVLPASSPARLQALMLGLTRRMTTETSNAPDLRDNPDITSGYTYLLQFVAHDLVSTSVPFWAVDDEFVGIRNVRTSRLLLDTLYGDGPTVAQAPFSPDDIHDTSRSKFRLGCLDGPAVPTATCPFRDIGRARLDYTKGADKLVHSEPLIADARNDDGAILAQVTVLFQALHNAIVDLLSNPAQNTSSFGETLQAATKRFECAREATTLIYRAIIRNDLLGKILHPAVRAAYDVAQPAFLDREFADYPFGPLPLEFSFGAFRFGHAMVRNHYQVNDNPKGFGLKELLTETSGRNPADMPLKDDWMVSWSRFFKMKDEVAPNLSKRIGPDLSPILLNGDLFGRIDQSKGIGLPYRDLISASLAGLWSADALIGFIKSRRPGLFAASKMFGAGGTWQADLAQWLAQKPDFSSLSPNDQAALAADPPLTFFTLFEAYAETGGASLGIVGSIIVAEVFYAILAHGPLTMPAGGDLGLLLRNLSVKTYGAERLQPLYEVDSMVGLIEFLAKQNAWDTAVPAFI